MGTKRKAGGGGEPPPADGKPMSEERLGEVATFLHSIGTAAAGGGLPAATVTTLFLVARELGDAVLHHRRKKHRFCIVSDGDGHDYVCPADLVEETIERFEQISNYWSAVDPQGDPPDEPDWVVRINGEESITFLDPRDRDGEPVGLVGVSFLAVGREQRS